MYKVGKHSVTHVPSGGWERRGGSSQCMQLGAVIDMSPVGDGGGEEDHCHVRSGGRSVTHVPSGG